MQSPAVVLHGATNDRWRFSALKGFGLKATVNHAAPFSSVSRVCWIREKKGRFSRGFQI